MEEVGTILERLKGAPTAPLSGTLVRCVALGALLSPGTPEFLYTSGRANRYNPPGVECIYFSEGERTARAEYDRVWGAALAKAARQPLVTFFAEVRLAHVLDLTTAETRKALRLSVDDLHARWRLAKKPVRTQMLGLAVSLQGRISAIRFPSDATKAAGFSGANVVIFRKVVHRPDRVRILGPTRNPLEEWPEASGSVSR